MAHFRYQALNAARETVAGELEAASVSEAIATLEGQGLSILSIGYSSPNSPRPSDSPRRTRSPSSPPANSRSASVGELERDVLRRHISSVLPTARALLPALRAYAEELPAGRRRRELEGVIRTIERGDSEESALALERSPGYWIPLFRAAASAPDSGEMLSEFLAESERAEELRRQWWRALSYPGLVALLALAVMTALSFLVIPIFSEIFISFDLPLPWFTVTVLNVAESITSGTILLVLGAIALALFLLWQARKLLPRWFRAGFDDSFGTPFGRTAALARFSQFTADLLEARLPVPDALRIAGFASQSMRVRRAAWRLAGQVESCQPADANDYRSILTKTLLHTAATDIPERARSRLMRELSASYAEQVQSRFSWTRGIIEPLAIVAIGVVVGGVVIAMFLPLISLVQGLSM